MPATSELELYEQINSIHDEMLEATLALAWDKLFPLNEQLASITSELMRRIPESMDNHQRSRKAELAQQAIAKHQQILNEIHSWRSAAEPLLRTWDRSSSK